METKYAGPLLMGKEDISYRFKDIADCISWVVACHAIDKPCMRRIWSVTRPPGPNSQECKVQEMKVVEDVGCDRKCNDWQP